MLSHRLWTIIALALACAGTGCSKTDKAAPVATPSVSIAGGPLTPGTLVPVYYRFAVASGATFAGNEMLFVHVVDDDGKLLWTDDHTPAIPTSQWKPGSVVEYSRELLIPTSAPASHVQIEVGLYAPQGGARLPMSGKTRGQRAYRVADLDVGASAARPLYLAGWNNPEAPGGVDWRWTKAEATVVLDNQPGATTLVVVVDQPVQASMPSRVRLLVHDVPVDSFVVQPGVREIRRIPVPASALKDAHQTPITFSVDRTFVPKSIPALHSTDSRELGVRVFTLYFERS